MLVCSFMSADIISDIAGQFTVRNTKIRLSLAIKVLTCDPFRLVPICIAADTSMFFATNCS